MSRGSYSSFFSLLFSIRFQGRFGGISCCTARVSTHLTEPSDFSGSTGLYPSNVRDGWRGIFISFGMRERLNDGDMRIWNSVSQLFFFSQRVFALLPKPIKSVWVAGWNKIEDFYLFEWNCAFFFFFFETPATSANYSERIKQYFLLFIHFPSYILSYTWENRDNLRNFSISGSFFETIYIFISAQFCFILYIYVYNKSCISIWMRLEQTFLAVRCSFDSNIIESIDWETLISGWWRSF